MPSKSRKHADSIGQSDLSSAFHYQHTHELSGFRAFLFKGTNGNEQIFGSGTADVMKGLGGDDRLWGMRGNDLLIGGAGDDYLSGGLGQNQAFGGAGNDYLDGWNNDYLNGGAGNDEFRVWAQIIAVGGKGNDHFVITDDRPAVLGGAGYDVVEFELSRKHFVASYKDDALLLRTRYGGFEKPELHMTDPTIEKIVWRDFALTLALKSTPTITHVYAQDNIEEGGTTTAPFQSISGQSDPFARIQVMADGIIIGTCVASYEGKWYLDDVYSDLPEGPINLTAVADYGAGTKSRTSESFDIVIGLPGGEVPGDFLYTMDSDEATFVTSGADIYLSFGYKTSALGDVNGDGIDDWLIPVSNYSGNLAGAGAYIIYGRDGSLGQIVNDASIIDLSTMTADRRLRIGVGPINVFFATMTTAGDLNGDGTDDLMFSNVENGTSSVEVVYSGIGQLGELDSQGRSSASIDDLNEGQRLTIVLREGASDADAALGAIRPRSVGDVNGDGFADLVVGVSDSLGSDAYLIYGGVSLGALVGGKRVLDVATLDANQGVHLSGYGLQLVQAAGDMNGDGLDDFIVGSRYNNIPVIAVIFGDATGIGEIIGSIAELDLRDLAPDQGLLIKDNVYGFWTNVNIEQIGDFNSDGYDDLLVQSHDRITVIFGSQGGLGHVVGGQREIVLDEISAVEGFTIDMQIENWQRGPEISAIGDFNGDGFDDFAINRLRDGLDNHDKAFVIFGTDQAMAPAVDGEISLTIQDLKRSQTRAFILDGGSLSAGGDLNGDGYDDLVTESGHPGYAPSVIYGHATSSTTSVSRTGTSAADILIGRAGNDTLDGNGGADVFRAGRGNDTIRIGDATFERINAGRGTNDTVEFDGANITLDARTFGNVQLRGIETFDLTGTGDNTLVLTAFDVFQLSPNRNGAFSSAESGNSVVVRGNDGDTLRLIDHPEADWTLADAGVGLDGASGGDFDIYQLRDGARILASVAVSEDVTFLN